MSWYAISLFAAEAGKTSSMHWSVYLLVALFVLVAPFFLGEYLGKKFRMPDHGWKIGLCLFTLVASVAILILGPPLKKGVDLSGGVILVYEVDQTQKKPDQPVDMMDKLVAAVQRRVNPGGQKEVTIRKYGVDQVEVIVPEVDDAEVQRIENRDQPDGHPGVPHPGQHPRQQRHRSNCAEADPSKIGGSRYQAESLGLVGAGEGGSGSAVSAATSFRERSKVRAARFWKSWWSKTPTTLPAAT